MEKQHIVTIQLAGISGVLMTILFSLLAFRFFVIPQGRASLSSIESESQLSPPYIRLETLPFDPGSQTVQVDVLANTGGEPIVGADVDLEYNPAVLGYSEKNVTPSNFFRAFQEDQFTAGHVRFSVFNSAELGDEAVRTNADQEVRVATVVFDVIDPTVNLAQIQVLFAPNQMDESNLILFTSERQEFPQDILKTTEGTIITLRSQPQ